MGFFGKRTRFFELYSFVKLLKSYEIKCNQKGLFEKEQKSDRERSCRNDV